MIMEFIEVLKIILLGIVEGITEWLPVSSTGHMILVDKLFPMNVSPEFKEVFLYFIQLGAILAVVVLFFKKLFPWKREEQTLNGAIAKKTVLDKGILNLWGKVLIACVPAVVGVFVGLPDNPLVVAIALIFYGVAFIVVEQINRDKTFAVQSTDDISYKQAFIIGLFQLLAIIPGTSRSGATILGALLIGISRPAGAEFTFYLAIPVMVGASGIKILQFLLDYGMFSGAEIGYLLIGAAVAFAVSMVAIKFLMNFVKKHDFKVFGWYRIALGVIVIAAIVIPSFIG
ncbi:MAG: undecaprenyl-diphosphate phosphatase [Clostridiales bacterium]|nr:undecaprenyl-diphosphate phosphatase [Clostridiales bacterium]